MILYNVTVKIAAGVEAEWLQWMKEVHIPDVMKTGLFIDNQICKVLDDQFEDGTTYAIQYKSPDMETFQKYRKEFAPALQKEHQKKYEGQYVAFRTLLEMV